MDVDTTRKSTSSRNGSVVAGSVWESRMKGEFKVFSDCIEQTPDENDDQNCTFLTTATTNNNNNNQVDKKGPKSNLGVGVSGKRKTWKADSPIQIAKKIPIQSKKTCELRKMKEKSAKELDENSKNLDGVVKKSNLEENKGVVVESSENLEGSKIQFEEKFITSKVVKNLENEEQEEEWDEVLEEEIEKDSVDVKEIRIQEQRFKKVVVEEEKFNQSSNKRQIPVSSIKNKPLPVNSGHVRVHPSFTRAKSVPVSDEFQRIPRQHRKLQRLVDIIMWRNVPQSALVFGIGTLVIISSSFIQDLNISFISVLSYLGLAHLAGIFLFRSLVYRGTTDISESSEYVGGEEEAIWVLKLILPCINEFLLKIRALFSGDPATTMKMAVLLFVLARYGSYITIWKLSKLGFFGVFIIPKIYSSYSTHLTYYGTVFIQYIRGAWESCSHKKAVGFVIFTLVWNFCSILTRIWAVFMLYVGFRYYQQTLMRSEGCVWEETTIKSDDSWQGKLRAQRPVGKNSSLMETRKQKEAF